MRPGGLAAVCLVAVAACSAGEAPGPLLHVDAGGWFVSAEPVPGRWYPAGGVRLLAPHEEDGRLFGRLEADPAGSDSALGEFATFDAEGTLQFVPVRRERSPEPCAEQVRRALAEALDGLPGSLAPALAHGLRATEPAPPVEVGHALDIAPGDAPPAPGAPLSAWAPRNCAYAHFRSVEAGYRLAGTFDDVVAHVLAGHGDARDAATVRLTLFHLLLPTIWRTNPGVSKGVSEMGLVVVTPFVRGPLTAAVLLRIEDPVRHEMHTKAGVAIESKPGHRWRPERDPFPEERVRKSVRRIVGDVEIVATDPALLESLAAGVRESWADDANALAFLQDPGNGLGHLAMTAVFPPDQEIDLDAALAARATRGVEHLLLELGAPGARGARVEPRFGSAPFHVRSLAVRTDRQGAHVTATLDGTPGLVEAVMHGTERDSWPRHDAACTASRGDVSALALVDGAAGDLQERCLVVLGYAPRCSEGGVLRIDAITRRVTCSLHGPPDVRIPRPSGYRIRPPYGTFRGGLHEVEMLVPINWSAR